MDKGAGRTNWRRRHFAAHEWALTILGIGTAVALLAASRRLSLILLVVLTASILYAWVIFAYSARTDRPSQRIRFVASFAFVVWFYFAVAWITPALGTTLRDRELLRVDEAIFGQTPAIFCEQVATARLTDLMSLCYLSYHAYLIAAVAQAAVTTNGASQKLGAYLFMGFAIGFVGYLLVPGIGPAHAFPELFKCPLAGGFPTRLVAELVATGSSRYDAFPSLHVLITCLLLDYDWREVRRRFWIMIVPTIGLVISTVYLRYHYGVDVLAAFLLFLVLRGTFLKIEKRQGKLPP